MNLSIFQYSLSLSLTHTHTEDMYAQAGSQFHDELLLHNLPSSLVKAIDARLEGIQPKVQSSDSISSGYIAGEIKPVGVNTKKSSPTAKSHQGRPLFLEEKVMLQTKP